MQLPATQPSMPGNGSRTVNPLKDLSDSPEWYPLKMDFKRRSLTFVRMSQNAYREATFHASRAAQAFGQETFTIRLDDVLLGAIKAPASTRPIHFILHGAFCCSTLLARYLELLDSSVVMKEPQWLTQLAMARNHGIDGWQELFDLSLRLLTRTYRPNELAVIKTNVPCNPLGEKFLEQNQQATMTFLMAPLRNFVVSALKSDFRRSRVRYWNLERCSSTDCPAPLANLKTETLSDEQAAVCFWLHTRFLCSRLSSGIHRKRVFVVNGERVAESPQQVLPAIAQLCGRPMNDEQLRWLLDHPSIQRHSKDTSRPYDASVRRQELKQLQDQYGRKIDAAIEWAISIGIDADWLTVIDTETSSVSPQLA